MPVCGTINGVVQDCASRRLILPGATFTQGAVAFLPGVYSIRYWSTSNFVNGDVCFLYNEVTRATISWPNCTRTIVIADTKPPEVTLIGKVADKVEGGRPYPDQGATALDIISGSMTFNANAPMCTLNMTLLALSRTTQSFANSVIGPINQVRFY